MRPLVQDDEEPDASYPLRFPAEATALVFLAAATGTRRIAAYGLPLSPIRGQPQGRILLIFLVFVFLVFVVFLIFLVFFLEIGERMRNIVPNPAHVPQQEGEDRSQSHEVVIRAPWKVVTGNRRPNTLPTSNMAAESTNRPSTTRITKTAPTRRYPIHVPSWAAQQDLSGSLPAGCITTRAPPRGNGERPSSGWSPCRRRWALHHPSCGPGRTPRQPTMPQSGIDVHNQQRPPVETVAKVVGHGYRMGSKGIARATGAANALLTSISGSTDRT